MASVVIVGEAWGREEAEARAPFIGSSGRILNSMLAQVGIRREDCFVTNVLNFQPTGPRPDNDLANVCGPKSGGVPGYPALSKGKYLRAEFQSELVRLYREIKNEAPTLIIALGASAAWALLGTSGIKKIRGAPAVLAGPALNSIGAPIKVLPTYHPAAVMREMGLRPIVIADLYKAKREMEFSELRRPAREIYIEPAIADLERFERDFILPSSDLSIDIETAGDQITCVGFAPTRDRALVVPFVDPVQRDGNYWRTLSDELTAWAYVRKWCALPTARGIGQNHLYDIHRLWRTYGIPILNARDDTMLLHHALQPEMEKGLGFLASIYTEELPWKFMRQKHETLKKED